MPRRTSVLFFCDLDVVLSNLDGSVEVIYYHNYLELFCYICYNNTGDTNNPIHNFHIHLFFPLLYGRPGSSVAAVGPGLFMSIKKSQTEA